MEENKEMFLERPIRKEDLREINQSGITKLVLKNTKGQDPQIIEEISKDIKIVIRDDFEKEPTTDEIEYTPFELSKIVSRFNQIESTINPEWTDLEKATYLYVNFALSTRPELESTKDSGLKSILGESTTPSMYATLYKEAMERQDIPCRILSSDDNHKFNEIMIDNTYYPLDLFLDAKVNQELVIKENRFELMNFLSDKEFYYKPEHKIANMTEEELKNVPALDHSLIQKAIDKVLHPERENLTSPSQPIQLKSKELQEVFGKAEIKDFDDLKEVKEVRIDFKDSNTDSLREDILEVGKYYPEILDNVILSNNTDSHVDMQQVVDSIYESKENQNKTQNLSTPTNLVIESKNEQDFDLDFSKVPEVKLDEKEKMENIDTTQKISFVNTSGSHMKMPSLEGKIGSEIDTISLKDFDVSGFSAKKIPAGPTSGKLKDGINLELTGAGTEGVKDLKDLDKVIGLTISGITKAEFNDIMAISIGASNKMGRLFNLTIYRQDGLQDRKIFEEIKNPNIINLAINNSKLNKIDGLDGLKNQLISLSLQNNDLSINQAKEIIKLSKNNPYVSVCVYGNSSISNAIDNLGNNAISDETYNYLDKFLSRSGYQAYRKLNYCNSSNTDKNSRKKELLKDFTTWSMQNIPYYIEDAKVFREKLPFEFNPMMIKDVTTFENYLNDPSNYFEQTHLKDGTLLLTKDQLNTLIASGKKIPQNINLTINTVNELENDELTKLKQECDNLGINFSGVRVYDQREISGEKVFDAIDTHLVEYGIDEYKQIRKSLEKVVEGIDDSLSDAEKFAIVYYNLSDLIGIYDPAAHTEPYSKEHAIYQSKVRNSSRNLSEGLIKQEGFSIENNSVDSTKENRSVCAGYADILKNALSLVGVESIIDSGNAIKNTNHNPNHPLYYGGHEWNKVKIDGKWYYADLCWDNGENVKKNIDNFKYALKGRKKESEFIYSGKPYGGEAGQIEGHYTDVKDGVRDEIVEEEDFNQERLKYLFSLVKKEVIPKKQEIVIPDDPNDKADVDKDRVKNEYKRRKDDMYAKFYGDTNYQKEYDKRNARFRKHEKEVTENGITYKTIENYPEIEEDKQFLILGEYKEALERMSKYEAGDTSVYSGTPDQVSQALEKDREYVTTRNHTFNQIENTQKDLATLGKYGEKLPYIQKQKGILRNIGRGILNAGIFARNLVSPVYRFIGKNIAQPIHRVVTGNRDASPYRNNFYHRMVARRDYFTDVAKQRDEDETNQLRAAATDPSSVKTISHPIRNFFQSRWKAVFNAKEGNEAVLRAGAFDIRENIEKQERERVLVKTSQLRRIELAKQVTKLEEEAKKYPNAKNIKEVRKAINDKKAKIVSLGKYITAISKGKTEDIQTDAVSQEQHAIASKEVNTARVTAIKGIIKGAASIYTGQKLSDWLEQRGKTIQKVDTTISKEVPDNKWVGPVFETVPETKTQTILDKAKSLKDIMSKNSGKQISGYETVWGGERGLAPYTLTGNEKITGIFKATPEGGIGFSDKAGLTAPTLTDGLFSNDLLDPSGVLNQNISIESLLRGIKDGTVEMSSLGDTYLSIGDQYWVKASDILSSATQNVTVETGKMIEKLVTPGHWVEGTKIVDETIKTARVIDNPILEKLPEVGGYTMAGIIGADTIQDIVENVRKTTTDEKSNKKKPRRYTYDDGETEPIPTSKKEYDESR